MIGVLIRRRRFGHTIKGRWLCKGGDIDWSYGATSKGGPGYTRSLKGQGRIVP